MWRPAVGESLFFTADCVQDHPSLQSAFSRGPEELAGQDGLVRVGVGNAEGKGGSAETDGWNVS